MLAIIKGIISSALMFLKDTVDEADDDGSVTEAASTDDDVDKPQ